MIVCKSYAKINLGLEIVRRRSDGYHEIRTIFQTVGIHDTITVQESETIKVICDHPEVPNGKENIIFKATFLLQRKLGKNRGALFRIEKKIPIQAGMGGGSSNAVMSMMALEKIWGTNLQADILFEIAKKTGADVPFFLVGGSALGQGIGDILEPLDDINPADIIIAAPRNIKISTQDAYKNVSQLLTRQSITNNITPFILGEKEISSLTNDFEHFLFAHFPLLEEIKNSLFHLGALFSGVTGSGSAVYGWFPVGTDLTEPTKNLQQKFPSVDFIKTSTVNRDSYLKNLFENR